MAITIRKGNKADFDPNKLVPGELALAVDTAELFFCYSAGNTKKLTTAEDVQNLLNASSEAYEALQQLLTDLEDNPSELTNILNNISALQTTAQTISAAINELRTGVSGLESEVTDINTDLNAVTYQLTAAIGVTIPNSSIIVKNKRAVLQVRALFDDYITPNSYITCATLPSVCSPSIIISSACREDSGSGTPSAGVCQINVDGAIQVITINANRKRFFINATWDI